MLGWLPLQRYSTLVFDWDRIHSYLFIYSFIHLSYKIALLIYFSMSDSACLWRSFVGHAQGIDCGADFKYSRMSRLSSSICRWCFCTPDEYFYHTSSLNVGPAGWQTYSFAVSLRYSNISIEKICFTGIASVSSVLKPCFHAHSSLFFLLCLFIVLGSEHDNRFFFFFFFNFITFDHLLCRKFTSWIELLLNMMRVDHLGFISTKPLKHLWTTLTLHKFVCLESTAV